MTQGSDTNEEKAAAASPVNEQKSPSSSDTSLKEYFDDKLYPHLSAALAACARERPEDPVRFIGNFLVNAAVGGSR
jgi:hypothetical protein